MDPVTECGALFAAYNFTKIEKHQRDNKKTMNKQGWLRMEKINTDYKRGSRRITKLLPTLSSINGAEGGGFQYSPFSYLFVIQIESFRACLKQEMAKCG